MARPGVTKEEVIEAIETLTDLDLKVTVESVRAELGRGSPNTINRYLREWRARPIQTNNRESLVQVKQLKKKCAELERQLFSQSQNLETLSTQLLDRDKELVEFRKTCEAQKHALEISKLEVKEATALHQTVVDERKQVVDSLVKAQKEQTAQFCEDLKAINQMGLEQVRDASMQGQDAWLEEKIKTRALDEKIELLNREKVEVQRKLDKERQMNQPLRKRLADQEKLIGSCLDSSRVEAYQQRSEVKS